MSGEQDTKLRCLPPAHATGHGDRRPDQALRSDHNRAGSSPLPATVAAGDTAQGKERHRETLRLPLSCQGDEPTRPHTYPHTHHLRPSILFGGGGTFPKRHTALNNPDPAAVPRFLNWVRLAYSKGSIRICCYINEGFDILHFSVQDSGRKLKKFRNDSIADVLFYHSSPHQSI